MARNMRRVKNGEKVTIYFEENLDAATSKWLNKCANKSYEISELVVKYANGELIEKSEVEKEKEALLDRIKDLKDMLDRVLPSANHQQTSFVSAASKQDFQSFEKKSSVEAINITASDGNSLNIVKKSDKPESKPSNESMNDGTGEKDKVNGIGNYKNGRGFRKKGKGLADLQ
jgi:uncharacterized Zn-finger protein